MVFSGKLMDFSAIFQDNIIMKNLIKIIFKDQVQQIFDLFSSIFNIRILFYSAAGDIVKVGLNRPNSDYCSLIQEKLYGLDSCLELDQAKRAEAFEKKGMICFTCHAGLTEALTPLFVEEKLLGFMGFGQIRTSNHVPGRVMKDWENKFTPPALENAYKNLPLLEIEKINEILSLFSILIEYIMKNNLISLKGDLLLNQIITFLEDNLHRSISLKDVSNHIDRSESTVSHLLKKKLNQSFKQTVIQIKLEKADEYLQLVPKMKIKDIAAKIGYDDALYFSRLYKKNKQYTPREFQQKNCKS
jgi:AraC-like DNA-binding protein